MNPEETCLSANMDKILEHISIKAERKKMESHLNMIIRTPNEPLESYTHLLFTLYNSYCTLDYIVDTKEADEGFEEMVNNPAQISQHKIVNDRVQSLLVRALRSLCSPEAQRNITELIRKKKNVSIPNDTLKEIIFKCDDRHPPSSSLKLPLH